MTAAVRTSFVLSQHSDSRDPAADRRMENVYTQHSAPVMRYVMNLAGGERQTAEDIFQETMLRAWKNLPTLPDDRTSTRRWLFVVAKRIAIDASRRRRARPTEVAFSVEPTLGTDDDIGSTVAARDIWMAFTQLSAQHQEILQKLYFQGRSTAQTAAELDIPEGTVKSRAHYALRKLRAATELK